MTSATTCARAARKRSTSLRGTGASADLSRTRFRIVSASGVPPGSRVVRTVLPRPRRCAARPARCVDLPEPSGPSNVMNLPRTDGLSLFGVLDNETLRGDFVAQAVGFGPGFRGTGGGAGIEERLDVGGNLDLRGGAAEEDEPEHGVEPAEDGEHRRRVRGRQ